MKAILRPTSDEIERLAATFDATSPLITHRRYTSPARARGTPKQPVRNSSDKRSILGNFRLGGIEHLMETKQLGKLINGLS
jgi:hypothetical protein